MCLLQLFEMVACCWDMTPFHPVFGLFLIALLAPLRGFSQTEVAGCTNPLALNFNPAATEDDGTCLGTGCPDPTASNFDVFTIFFPGNGDSTLCTYEEVVEVLGCMDSSADNFNPLATVEDGSCTYAEVAGCTDATAFNFNSEAVEDDGSCVYLGCPDSQAINYDPLAAILGAGDVELCEYAGNGGCTDASALNFDAAADYNDGSCTYAAVLGCTDPFSWNYNPMATEDDGSCMGSAGDFGSSGCADPMAANFNPFFFLFAEGASVDDCIYNGDELTIPGCTDESAANYNPLAQVDNGTCLFAVVGCTDPNALNFNAAAVMDDGSCIAGMDVLESAEWGGLSAELMGFTDAGEHIYRLYAQFNEPDVELTTVFGMAGAPLAVSTDEGTFLQTTAGATFADEWPSGIDDGTAAVDTWLTIGIGDDLTYVGDAITAFATEGAPLLISSEIGGAWFRVPGSGEAGTPDPLGRVLLGQFIASGNVSVTLNLQYFDATGMPAQVHGATASWPVGTDPGSGSPGGEEEASCSGDLDGDGTVSVQDLLDLIAQFGNDCE